MVAAGTQRQRERSTTGYTLDDGGDDSGDALDQWQASLDNRVALQASVTWSGLQDGSIDAGAGDAANPYTSVYWTLQPVKTMHCGDCIDLAAKSPYDPPWDTSPGSNQLNQTPGDGQTECGAGCKCELDYKPNWSEIQALAAGQGWHFWLGPNAVPYPGGGIEDMGTAAGYAPPNIAEYGQSERDQAAAAQGYTPPSAVLRPFWQQDARRIGQVGQLGRSPQLAMPEQIPGPTGDTLSEGQQRALDRFREAVRAWDTVRGGLPEAPRLFEIGDAGEIIEREGMLPEWDSLTSAQQLAVNDLVAALWEWFEAAGYLDDLDDLDGGGGGDQQFAERASERGAYRLGLPGGGQPVGYDQPRGAHGHWAPGLGRTQQEHEAAGGRAGGLRGPAGEVHEHAPGGGGGAGGGGSSGASPSPTQLRAEIAHLRQRDAQLAVRRQDLEGRNQQIRLQVRRLDLNDPVQAAQGRALMQEYNDNHDAVARIGRIHQRLQAQIATRRAVLYPNAGASREDEHGQHMPFSRDEFEQAMRPATATPISANNLNMAFWVTIHGTQYFAKEAASDEGRYDAYAQARNEAATIAAMHVLGDGDLAPAAAYHIVASNGSSWSIQEIAPGREAKNYLPLGAAQHVTDDQLARAYLDQYVLGMQDRHPGNLLIDEQGHKPVEIDNGYGFKRSTRVEKRDTARDIWRAKATAAGQTELVIPRALVDRLTQREGALLNTLERFGVPMVERNYVRLRLLELASMARAPGGRDLTVERLKRRVGQEPDYAFSAG